MKRFSFINSNIVASEIWMLYKITASYYRDTENMYLEWVEVDNVEVKKQSLDSNDIYIKCQMTDNELF